MVRFDNISNRLGKSEERIGFLELENQKMKGELTMLRYLGIAIAMIAMAAVPIIMWIEG